MPLFLLFIIVPIIEIALFIQVGGLIGLWPTIALVLLSAVIGTVLIRSQGARALNEIQQSFRTLSDPTRPLAHGAMILLAGLLLLTPGFFTDTIGLLLLVPAVRDWVMRRAGRHVKVSRGGFGFDSAEQPRHGWPGRDDEVIDGDYVVQDDPYTSRDDIELPKRELPGDERRQRSNRPSGWTRPD
ncbi:FxsA family protein [Paracoccus aurantiacus]|uniref:FxsA family protein n=1 Tax=Paracoccus aurantiacus TaxID=2599412 RepID=A0A5C6S1H0_9RHOB|nr:FxsA family protein [Paracoccus aurantiacus]TXB67819.1 FxsA family protein [Paracoccus aurantiacus]